MKRLSGWTRLWIVFAVLTWGITIWVAISSLGLPPDPTPDDALVCVEQWRASGRQTDSLWLTECPDDAAFLEAAHNAHNAQVALYPSRLAGFLIPGALIPFWVMLAFLVIKWVGRGFRQTSKA